MNSKEQCNIYEALMCFCPIKLHAALEAIDPNTCEPGYKFPHHPSLLMFPETKEQYNERLEQLTFGARLENTTCFISFVDIVIYNCQRYKLFSSTNQSIEVVKLLMSYHLKYANVISWSKINIIVEDVVIFNLPSTYHFLGSKLLINYLDTNCVSTYTKNSERIAFSIFSKYIDKFTEDMAIRLDQISQTKDIYISTKMIPESVYNMLETLLFSEKFSDVIFEVFDESVTPPCITMLHAHRCILASSSEFFNVMLSGKWKESNNDATHAIIKVNHSLEVYKSFLTYIYTGNIDRNVVKTHSIELVDLAAECQYHTLVSSCETEAASCVSIDNVMAMLVSAYRHELKLLKGACFKFIKANSMQLMVNTSFTSFLSNHESIANEIMML